VEEQDLNTRAIIYAIPPTNRYTPYVEVVMARPNRRSCARE